MPRKLRSGERVRVLPVPSARPVRAASRHEVHALVVALPRGAGMLVTMRLLQSEKPPPDVHFHT